MVKIRKKPINRLKYINPAVSDEYKLQIIKHKREKKEMVIIVLKLIIESFALMTLRWIIGGSTSANDGILWFTTWFFWFLFFLAYWNFMKIVPIMLPSSTVIQNPFSLTRGFK